MTAVGQKGLTGVLARHTISIAGIAEFFLAQLPFPLQVYSEKILEKLVTE